MAAHSASGDGCCACGWRSAAASPSRRRAGLGAHLTAARRRGEPVGDGAETGAPPQPAPPQPPAPAQPVDEHVLRAFAAREGELTDLLRRRLVADVEQSDTAVLLTLTDARQDPPTVRRPSPSLSYVACLAAYLGQDGDIRAGIEDVVAGSVERASIEFVRDEAVYADAIAAVTAAVATDRAFRRELATLVQGQVTFVAQELRRVGDEEGAQHLLDGLTALQLQVGGLLAQTAASGALAAFVAKALALPAVKVAVVKGLMYVAGSAAFQKALLVLAKKYGVVLVVQAVLLKLGASVSAGVVSVALLLPVIAWLLHHEWKSFPRRLAGRLGDDLAPRLGAGDSEYVRHLARAFADVVLEALEARFHDAAGRVAAGRHERARRQHDLFESWLGAVTSARARRTG